MTQFENERFIKMNELKLTQVDFFSFFHFICVAAADASKLFCMAIKQIMNAFYIILNFHFKH